MSNEVTDIKISDIGETVTGKTPSSSLPEDFGNEFMFITPSDEFDEKYIHSTNRYLSNVGYNRLKSKSLKPHSVLVSCIGSAMGKVTMNSDFAITNQQINSIVVNEEKYSSHYVYYLLKNNYNLLRNAASGSTALPLLNKSDFDELRLKVHINLNTQQKIAAVLSALDDKIEVNNKINAELEAMSKTLYDYWFVQFDFPNEDNKPYKSSGGKMVLNETLKREIPEGWEVKSLYSIADFINGLACQKYRPENESDDFLPVIKIREMNDGISSNTEKVKIDIPEKNKIDDGDILFSWSATLDVKIWTQGKGGLNQHIFKVISKDYPKSFYYFELLNYLEHFKMMAELRKTTMGHITIDHLKTSLIAIPSKELILKMDTKLTPILNKIISNKKQNQELAQLRDWLLPMLMNGQVTVGEALEATEKQLAMVAEPSVDYKIKDDIKENRFALWLSNQKLAARGDIDEVVLREIFDAMDDEDQ